MPQHFLTSQALTETAHNPNIITKGALLIVRNDTILLEQYYGNFSELSPSNIFSITKAVTSLLCGIAVYEGLISISAPITEYIPELNEKGCEYHLLFDDFCNLISQ